MVYYYVLIYYSLRLAEYQQNLQKMRNQKIVEFNCLNWDMYIHTNSFCYYFNIYCCPFLSQLTKHLSLDNLSTLKSLSPVPEENEPADCENDSGKINEKIKFYEN